MINLENDFCTCNDAMHLCVPCGAKLAKADTNYKRIWTWRTRFTIHHGGLGIGVGEGNEGVLCARGPDCLGAQYVEVEFECPASSSPAPTGPPSKHYNSNSSDSEGIETPIKEKEEAGYWTQEIEGLGGVVKKKFRKRERVGGTVREWEDESRGGEILRREKLGEDRAWCGWCERLVAARGEPI